MAIELAHGFRERQFAVLQDFLDGTLWAVPRHRHHLAIFGLGARSVCQSAG